MKLKELLCGVAVLSTNADYDYEVASIKISSGEVEEHDLFLCMEGARDDGNNYIGNILCGFVAVSEKQPDIDVKYVVVEDIRKTYSIISQNYFKNPIKDMKFVAVIGTNGKTSTAHYISSMLTSAGLKTGLIGTEGHFICGEKVGGSLTTPDPFELNALFEKMKTKGVDVVVSEVSAHAIYLDKLYGIKSDVAVLTNVSQDHLDYFKDFDSYSGVKLGYFTSFNTDMTVVNLDDLCGKKLADKLEKTGLPHLSYGINNPADCFAMDVKENIDGIKFIANLEDDIIEVRSGLYGEFNVYNLLAAMCVCKLLGLNRDAVAYAASRVRAVKGRFSVLSNDKGSIIIDYAHTPDGLKNLLATARTITKSRLIALFGCGGDRDVSKRRSMGEIASRYSDFVVLTSDNPRYEEPEKIIEDIQCGVVGDSCKAIPDRTEAIKYALTEMMEGDTLVIAGKGNEGYLEIKGKRLPYNDFDVVSRWDVK